MTDTRPTPITAGSLSAINGIAHGFFTRQGGVSGSIYASLNVGFGSDDTAEDVAENRRRALTALDGAAALNTVYQVHGKDVEQVTGSWDPADSPHADAMVTATPGIAIGVLSADCTPVLFAAEDGAIVGAAHAGWRGAVGGVLGATVAAMEEMGADRQRIHAAVGPTIAQSSYEVGPEFPAPFLAENEDNARFFRPSTREGHHMFDLPGYVEAQLKSLGLSGIDVLPHDTCAEEDLFFSYRRATHRGETDYGRGLSAILVTG